MKPTMKMSLLALARRGLCVAACAFAGLAAALPADIDDVPPSTLTSSDVRPNLMFILDDSGSMDEEHAPDSVGNNANRICYAYHGYNPLFFNPTGSAEEVRKRYLAPRVGDGSNSMPDVSFTSAKDDGYNASSSAKNLSQYANLRYYTKSTVNNGWCNTGTAGCAASDTMSSTGERTIVTLSSCSGSNCYRRTTVRQYYYYATLKGGALNNCSDANYDVVSVLDSDRRQAYANWYQYYRSRMLMMRTASGMAFDQIDPKRFRVGFSTISERNVADNNRFLNVRDYDAQKAAFFSRLYGNAPSGYTPLRSALQKAGQYFAKKAPNQTIDPMQYSCQRNYTLLSTDGYWNTSAEPSQPYLPKRLDSSAAIGDMDGDLATSPRPKYDKSASKNSLADIAKYYYDTDLRNSIFNNCTGTDGADVCKDREVKVGDTSPRHQYMTTFTLGLGVNGVWNYSSDYETAESGDFRDIVNGTKDWPDPQSSTNNGYANTGNTVISRIDDLWHAAVNGGGHYYSATNSTELAKALVDALNKINIEDGAASAAATSTLRPVAEDDWIFVPRYQKKSWAGDIGAYHFTFESSGAVSVPTTPVWNAYKTLGSQADRSVMFFDKGSANRLKNFTYDNLTATQKSYFDNLCATPAKLSQCAEVAKLPKITGTNVVAFLRGSKQYEELDVNPAADRVFRARGYVEQATNTTTWTPLGDIVNSSLVYVRRPPFKYQDAGYAEFKGQQESRPGMVYVGANDGMLHAFRATDGREMWAFVPSAVMSNMYRLADTRYESGHRFFVDATPTVGDVSYFDTATQKWTWRTILIGGLGAGGRGYYALDITDPANPVGLWEFTDTHLGLSFGNPVIGKNKAGTWVVAFTSGYNNINPGDGNGRLWVLNALTGEPVIADPIVTRFKDASGVDRLAGDAITPNNLGPINGWVQSELDNTIEYIYGGDMQGNVWRFDFDDRVVPAGREAFRMGIARTADDKIQPITVPPLLGEPTVESVGKIRVVGIGTGRYLGSNDLSDLTTQSLYVFRERLNDAPLGDLRRDAGLVQQVMDANHQAPTTQNVDWSLKNGWYIDFNRSPGERINVEMDLQLNPGIVTVSTTVPEPTPCSPGGTSWLYYFRLDTGSLLASEHAEVLIVGLGNLVENTGTNNERMATISVRNDGSIKRTGVPLGGGAPPPAAGLKRTSWRELVN